MTNIRLARWGRRYKRLYTDEQCIYCGMLADLTDHVPSLARVDNRGAVFGEMVLVDCCAQCNAMARYQSHKTVRERRQWLYKRYERRLRTSGATWTKEELTELGRGLRQFVGCLPDIWERNRFRLLMLKTGLISSLVRT